MEALNINTIQVGMNESCSKKMTEDDVISYAQLSGDVNPVHLDDNYAKNSRFSKKIVHGLLSAGLFSAIFGTKLPGSGCVYVSQYLNFKRPVYIGDTVLATVTVLEVNQKSKKIKFKTVCSVNSKIVIEGEAEVFIPGEK